jgi:hypothetical protein
VKVIKSRSGNRISGGDPPFAGMHSVLLAHAGIAQALNNILAREETRKRTDEFI